MRRPRLSHYRALPSSLASLVLVCLTTDLSDYLGGFFFFFCGAPGLRRIRLRDQLTAGSSGGPKTNNWDRELRRSFLS
ncbi:uncharacterized protein BDZ83DRAFT_203429 [Colletotrichum acutatum]|uniref:Uncharacterized protein n=1 Tax=Glomerella acutata TaxID=27357 RepID=A0AAD8US42_GLOAC|nr:uncharacterized protein BDZ83DRAFT_203429 [Colletotrichum acutatum]KAK1727415.1 hypothetical protein BDZ83DRAFT_203429 [Colletotrichum acutatum]